MPDKCEEMTVIITLIPENLARTGSVLYWNLRGSP